MMVQCIIQNGFPHDKSHRWNQFIRQLKVFFEDRLSHCPALFSAQQIHGGSIFFPVSINPLFRHAIFIKKRRKTSVFRPRI